jgi:hypothetical protein
MKFYIVGNRAFNSKLEAIQYCNKCDFDPEIMVETQTTKKRYYELQTTPDNSIFHNVFLTSEAIQKEHWQERIIGLKNEEYYSRFVHLKEIPEKEYLRIQKKYPSICCNE